MAPMVMSGYHNQNLANFRNNSNAIHAVGLQPSHHGPFWTKTGGNQKLSNMGSFLGEYFSIPTSLLE
tara:strand:- start:56 stop:256 length:201 start_codon:yes stop_codon:yes gene_type:complete